MPHYDCKCPVCGREFVGTRSTRVFCSGRCRTIAYRARLEQMRVKQVTKLLVKHRDKNK